MPAYTSTREELFAVDLVPLGQIAEVILETFKNWHTPKVGKLRTTAAHRIFEVLNLASCFAIDPNVSEEQLRVLKTALRPLRFQLVGSVCIPSKSESAMEIRLKQLIARISAVTSAMHSAIGYTPETRSTWLTAHTASSTPLTQKGKMNTWRTFVRHCVWDNAFAQLPVEIQPYATEVCRNLQQSHSTSFTLANELWDATFNPAAPPMNPLIAGSLDLSERLPPEMRVEVTPQGLLLLTVDYSPIQALTPSEQVVLRRESVPASFERLVQPVSNTQETTISGLAAAVADGKLWLEAQKSDGALVKTAFEELKTARKRARVMQKVSDTFSKDEISVLAELFKMNAFS
jgi:hypothetical protein